MDIELLSKMIRELVPDREEVGLPGLGTFMSEFVPASFSDRGYTINPPYKRVTFVPGRTEDDSLVKLYAKSNDIDEDQSKAIIQHFLEETKKVLMDRKTVVFPGLGRLRATRQNNFFFITDESLDIYPDGYGLQSISLKNHEETPAEVHHVVSSLADILVEPADTEMVEPAEPETSDGAVVLEPVATLGSIRGGTTSVVGPNDSEAVSVPPTPSEAEESEVAEVGKEAGDVQEAEPEEPEPEPVPRQAYVKPALSVKLPEYPKPVVTVKKAKYIRPKNKVRRHINKWVWLAPLIVILVAALALAVFLVLAHVTPDFIDSILYTPEELRIINY